MTEEPTDAPVSVTVVAELVYSNPYVPALACPNRDKKYVPGFSVGMSNTSVRVDWGPWRTEKVPEAS